MLILLTVCFTWNLLLTPHFLMSSLSCTRPCSNQFCLLVRPGFCACISSFDLVKKFGKYVRHERIHSVGSKSQLCQIKIFISYNRLGFTCDILHILHQKPFLVAFHLFPRNKQITLKNNDIAMNYRNVSLKICTCIKRLIDFRYWW